MLYHPELFVYLMLLPVICFVVLPTLFSTTRAVIGVAKTTKAPEVEESFSQELLAEA